MQMNRREAMRKLAVGAAAATTASAVISSPVFGDELPTPPAAPVVDASVDPLDALTLIVTVSPGTATCNGNASGIASVAGFQITLSATPSTVTFTGNNDVVTGGGSLTATFTKPADAAATAQINYFANYRCTYATGSALLCTLRIITFGTVGTGGNAWSTSPTIVTDQTYPGCPGAT